MTHYFDTPGFMSIGGILVDQESSLGREKRQKMVIHKDGLSAEKLVCGGERIVDVPPIVYGSGNHGMRMRF